MKCARIIAHLDMDAFYASAELIREPRLKGLPVAIGGRRQIEAKGGEAFPKLSQYTGRGVLTTANYEARKLGIHSAMPTMKAAKLAPDAILLPADFEWYKHLSRSFKKAVAEVVPEIEDRGIDEIYLDLSTLANGCFDTAIELAAHLKGLVKESTGGMTCSIGLSENKLTSKIASDLEKPNGLSVVRPEEFAEKIWPLPVAKVNGIGPKAQAKLLEISVRTVGDLAAVDRAILINRFGVSYGAWLADSARGIDLRPLSVSSFPKSISRETTFERDMRLPQDKEKLSEILENLCLKLEADLVKKRVRAKTIGVKIRFPDFSICTRDNTVIQPVRTSAEIVVAARAALRKVSFGKDGIPSSMRLLGVRASGLISEDERSAQMVLFD